MNVKSTLIEAHIFRKVEGHLEYLLMQRAKDEIYPNIWQMVTGSVEQNEKAFQTAYREIQEETSLIPRRMWVVPNVNSFYLQSDDSINMVPVFVAEVDSDSQIVLSSEHTEYKWCKKEDAKKLLAWAGQRNSVDIISEYFSETNSLLNLIEINKGEI